MGRTCPLNICAHLSFRMDDGMERRGEERKIKELKGKERKGMGKKERKKINE